MATKVVVRGNLDQALRKFKQKVASIKKIQS